jgi:hypothetical protein
MALFFSALFLVAIGPHCSADPKPVNKENTMIIRHKYFQFKVPAGFEDKSVYTFRSNDKMDQLGIQYEQAQEKQDLKALNNENRENAQSYFGSKIKVSKNYTIKLGGWPALGFAYQYKENGKKMTEFWAMALENPRSIIAIRYAGEHANEKEFQHIMASALPIGQHPEAPPAKGYERRDAGRFSIDIPDTWSGPPSYYLVAKDGLLNLNFNVIQTHQKSEHHELSYIQKSEEADGNIIKDQKRERVTIKSGQAGQQFKYLLDDSEHPYNPTITAVQRVFIELGPIDLHIWAKTKPDQRSQMDAALSELVAGIEVVR